MAVHDLVPRVAAVRETIDRSLARSGRSQPVTIIAVTKTHPAEAVTDALAAGLRDVGENRVQEALQKQLKQHGLGLKDPADGSEREDGTNRRRWFRFIGKAGDDSKDSSAETK